MSQRLGCLAALVALCAALAESGLAAGGGDEELAKILQNWRKRQEATSSVRYVTKGDHVIARGRYNKNKKGAPTQDIPAQDLRFHKHVTWMVDFKNNWIRKETDTQSFHFLKKELRPFFAVDFYDGTTMVRSTPREKNTTSTFSPAELQPDLTIKPDQYEQYFLLAPDYPVFLAHGNVPTIKKSPSPKHVMIPIHKGDFVVDRKAILDDKECVVLKSGSEKDVAFDEYWVDQSRDSIILRWARYRGAKIGGKLWAQTDLKYEQHPFAWLPKSWNLTHCNNKDVFETVERLEVVAVDVNPSFEITQFKVAPSPGQIVEDMAQKKLLRADSRGVLRDFEGQATASQAWYWVAALVVVVVVFAVAALTVISRRKQAR